MEEVKQAKKWISCAIYTRKSTSEGLDQDFTSLDAQRESCESYIKSQKNEGWLLLKDRYDDGGFTGANIERPGLQKLLADIKEHKIDCVVVYKVDRLSRSLMDFAQLLEFFDKNSVTFVSITQAFNTNTSMGRLTLNILLSFAQFEREIISERTKDKMAAARKRGQWLGGRAPLGYDVAKDSKKLTINPEESKLIKEIFNLYLQGNSLLKVAQILNERGIRTKKTTSKKGRTFGGFRYGVTQIQFMITHPMYIGKVEFGGQIYEGQQEAIIDEATFKKAQEKLKQNRVERRATKNSDCTGLLSKLIHCRACDKMMFHTYALKNHHKYRYYLCSSIQKHGPGSCPTHSFNAQAIENAVVNSLRQTFAYNNENKRQEVQALLSPVWDTLYPEEKRRILKTLIKEIDYDTNAKKLGITLNDNDRRLEFGVDFEQTRQLNRWHKEKEIVKEPAIRKNLLLAYQIERLMAEDRIKDFKQAAEWMGMSYARISQLMLLNFLSAEIKEQILSLPSKQLSSISDNALREIAIEVDWQNQKSLWQELLRHACAKSEIL